MNMNILKRIFPRGKKEEHIPEITPNRITAILGDAGTGKTQLGIKMIENISSSCTISIRMPIGEFKNSSDVYSKEIDNDVSASFEDIMLTGLESDIKHFNFFRSDESLLDHSLQKFELNLLNEIVHQIQAGVVPKNAVVYIDEPLLRMETSSLIRTLAHEQITTLIAHQSIRQFEAIPSLFEILVKSEPVIIHALSNEYRALDMHPEREIVLNKLERLGISKADVDKINQLGRFEFHVI